MQISCQAARSSGTPEDQGVISKGICRVMDGAAAPVRRALTDNRYAPLIVGTVQLVRNLTMRSEVAPPRSTCENRGRPLAVETTLKCISTSWGERFALSYTSANVVTSSPGLKERTAVGGPGRSSARSGSGLNVAVWNRSTD